jgi:subtilisin family serine protease
MKRKNVFFVISLMLLVLAGCVKTDNPLSLQDESALLKNASLNNKYIVVLNEDADISISDLQSRNEKVTAKAYGLIKKYEITGEIEEVYKTALQGFTIRMAPGQAKKLALDSDVKYVEADKVIALSPIEANRKPGGGGSTPPPETTPWGITRVGGGETYNGNNVAWIIDTGVDLTHPDLNVDASRGVSFVSRVTSPNDDNGHGSHVAGIIAAIDNEIGVVGVAAGATVVPVKVLNRQGSGYYSWIIAGVDYVAENGNNGDVANLSLGGPAYQPLDDAVIGAAHLGIRLTLAAGNESDNANNYSPSRVNGTNIYTVSAMWEGDLWASFSNYGNPPVDYCAPGVYIYSCYKNGGYATMSGTSMAAPHVAGVLLLGRIHTDGYVSGDPDGDPDPIAHN